MPTTFLLRKTYRGWEGKNSKQASANTIHHMKKLAFLLLLASLGQRNIQAQGVGTFQFNNSSTFPILIDPDIGGQTYVIGTSNAMPYGAGPGKVAVQLYVALASAPNQFFLAGMTTNSGSMSPAFLGTFHGGNPYTIPSTLDGGAFTQGTVIDYYFTAESSDGAGPYVGTSATGAGYVLAGGVTTPAVTFGTGTGQIPGFIIGVPEPSTLAIGGLGALAALLYRRRKGSSCSFVF